MGVNVGQGSSAAQGAQASSDMNVSADHKASGSTAIHLLGQIEECNVSLEALLQCAGTENDQVHEALRLQRRLLRLSAQLSMDHLEHIASWRNSFQVSAKILTLETFLARQGQHFGTDHSLRAGSCPRTAVDTVLDVLLDLQHVEATLRNIRCKLESLELPDSDSPLEILRPPESPCAQEQQCTLSEAPVEGRYTLLSHKALGKPAANTSSASEPPNDQEVEGRCPSEAAVPGLGGSRISLAVDTGRQEIAEGCVSVGPKAKKAEGTEAEMTEESPLKAKGRRTSWVTVALARGFDGPTSCYVTAPVAVAADLSCEEADDLSALLVSEYEELVSHVLRIHHAGKAAKTPFPLSVVLPFRVRYRCSHRDVMVKVIDEAGQASYVHPVATEGTYEGQRGPFAEVRVYMLGLFAVVLCLRKEHFTVPTKGLCHRLSVDTRICLDYPPCCFSAPVVVQAMVQPMEGALLSHCDAAQVVLSTSPLLYLSHPHSKALCRPLTITLPCPPGPDRRAEEEAGSGQLASATPFGVMTFYNARVTSASVKLPPALPTEPLVLLGWREGQWMVLEDVPVRNLQNGLASFELMEHVERLIVFRLTPCARPSLLTSLMSDVEESVATIAVSLVLLQKQTDPEQAVMVAVPTRDLDWDLGRLCAEGYSTPSDPPPTVALREGEQLQLSFSGNITSTGHSSSAGMTRRLTFHKQRENRVFLTLAEVDEFGNYSSPHYRGTVVFHRVSKVQLTHSDMVAHAALSPICKLPLTLPKKVRAIMSRCNAKVTSCCQENEPLSDHILLWLAEELVEEDVACLVPRLCLRRGAIQRAQQLAPHCLTDQVLHLLVLWRRGLPAITDKAHMLARHLSRCGRPDLSRELLLRRGGDQEAQEKQATTSLAQ